MDGLEQSPGTPPQSPERPLSTREVMNMDARACSSPSTPDRESTSFVSTPRSPAEDYRMRRREAHSRAQSSTAGSHAPQTQHETEFLLRSPPSKIRRYDAPEDIARCSMCYGSCTHARNKIGLGARVSFALVAGKFVRALAGELLACETCSKALSRAKPLLVALENIIVESPQLHAGGPVLRVEQLRRGVQLLSSEFKSNPSAVESQLRSLSPAHGWVVLPALCCGAPGCGKLQLLKDPKDNHFGIVQLCSTPFDRSTGLVVVEDTIDRRPFKVAHFRLIPLPGPHSAPGIAAAPYAAAAEKGRLARDLKKVSAELADLESNRDDILSEFGNFQKQVLPFPQVFPILATLTIMRSQAIIREQEQSKEIGGLSANLRVAQHRAGHAYQQGMYRFRELECQLQEREKDAEGFKQQISKVGFLTTHFCTTCVFNSRTIPTAYGAHQV